MSKTLATLMAKTTCKHCNLHQRVEVKWKQNLATKVVVTVHFLECGHVYDLKCTYREWANVQQKAVNNL